MGDPKKKQKRYSAPRVPYDTEMFMEDLKLLGAYGLRNKRELWRIRTLLSHYRRRARELLAMTSEERSILEPQLIGKLSKMGLITPNGNLDDILTMSLEDFMERRLQTYIYRKGMVKSLYQARQLISHGHISIKGRAVTSPSYHVTVDDEASIDYSEASPYHNTEHELRKALAVDEAAAQAAPQGGNRR